MNHFRFVAIGTMLMVALTALAQEAATAPGSIAKQNQGHAQDSVPGVEQHLKVLSEKLDLSGDQQARTRPILQELHDATEKLVQDQSRSREERLKNVRTYREKADKQIREILSDDQKKKLDQLEREPHSGLHGNVHGATEPGRPPKS